MQEEVKEPISKKESPRKPVSISSTKKAQITEPSKPASSKKINSRQASTKK
jgi:hypothetical protein